MEKKNDGALTLRTPPSREESLFGFLARITERTGEPKLRRITDLVDLKLDQSKFSDADIQRVAEKTLPAEPDRFAAGLETLRAIAPTPPTLDREFDCVQILGTTVPFDAFYTDGKRRVCPKCIAEKGIHRLEWDLKFIQVCPIHGNWLAQQCPEEGCEKPLDWLTGRVHLCTKGHDLREIEPPTVSEDETYSARVLSAVMRGTERAPELLTGLPFHVVIEVLKVLAGLDLEARMFLFPNKADPGLVKRFGQPAEPVTMVNRIPAVDIGRRFTLALMVLGLESERLELALRKSDTWGVRSRIQRCLASIECESSQLGMLVTRAMAT